MKSPNAYLRAQQQRPGNAVATEARLVRVSTADWTIIGIVASAIAAAFFYWLGAREARRQNAALRLQLADLSEQGNVLKGMLAGTVQSFVQSATSANSSIDAPSVGAHPRRNQPATPQSATPDGETAAVDELVRGWLGALVNERGDVEVGRLLREVSRSLGAEHLTEVIDALGRLDRRGVIGWDGDADVTRVQTVRLGSADAHHRLASSSPLFDPSRPV